MVVQNYSHVTINDKMIIVTVTDLKQKKPPCVFLVGRNYVITLFF
jgi:hypothetical protein